MARKSTIEQERRISDRKRTREIADLYFEDQFVQSCSVSSVSPTGVFVRGILPRTLTRGMRVELYFPVVAIPEGKLLCMRGVIARKTKAGTGIRVFSRHLPIVPAGA